jgi:hypothetical protein
MEKSPHLSQRGVPPQGLPAPPDVVPSAPMVLQALPEPTGLQEQSAHQEV